LIPPRPSNFHPLTAKKIIAAFEGGRISSDGVAMLLAQVERLLGFAVHLLWFPTIAIRPASPTGSRPIRVRLFATCCGYEDCNDFDQLCSVFDPRL